MIKKHIKYFDTVHNYAAKKGRLATLIRTSNYGDIEVWAMAK